MFTSTTCRHISALIAELSSLVAFDLFAGALGVSPIADHLYHRQNR